jgi:hypothetical protein
MIFDWQYLFDSVKKHGLVAVFMGAIIYIQYRSYEDLKVEFKAEQKEMRTKLEKQIQDLEIKLLDCQNQRFLELLRQRDND